MNVSIFKVLSCFSFQFRSLRHFIFRRETGFVALKWIHRERSGVRRTWCRLVAHSRVVRVASGQTQLIRRMNRSVHVLGELIIDDWIQILFSIGTNLVTVSKVDAADETEIKTFINKVLDVKLLRILLKIMDDDDETGFCRTQRQDTEDRAQL